MASQVTRPHTNELFFLLGYIKAMIYTLPLDSEEALIARIVEAAATIRQQPGIFECSYQSHQSLLHRHQLCIKVGGCTLEQLL